MTRSTLKKTILQSDELTCPTCVAKIEKRLDALPGVGSAAVKFATGRIEVAHDPERVSVDELIAGVAAAGYRARERAF
ncbi:MAG: cation transporter [Solirubrobacteraceae bacterium]|nr:cation transporter [Solirubrobacteraceae bacterium]